MHCKASPSYTFILIKVAIFELLLLAIVLVDMVKVVSKQYLTTNDEMRKPQDHLT